MDVPDSEFSAYWNGLPIAVRRLATQHWARRACARLSLSGYQVERLIHRRHQFRHDSAVEIDSDGQWHKYLGGKASVSSPEKLRRRFCWINAIDHRLPGHSSLLMAPLWVELTPRLTDESELLSYSRSLAAPYADEVAAAALLGRHWGRVDDLIDWDRCFNALPIEKSLDIAGRWRCWLVSSAPVAGNDAVARFDRRMRLLKIPSEVDRALFAIVSDFWKKKNIPADQIEGSTERYRRPFRTGHGRSKNGLQFRPIPARNYILRGNSSRHASSVEVAWREVKDRDSLQNWRYTPLSLRRLATHVWADEALKHLSCAESAERSNTARQLATQCQEYEGKISESLIALRVIATDDCAVARPRAASEDIGLVMEVEHFSPGLQNILEWDLWCLLSVTYERDTPIAELFASLPLPLAQKLVIVWRKFENSEVDAAPLALVLAELAQCDALASWPTVAQLCNASQLRMSFETWLALMDKFWSEQATRSDLSISSLGAVAWRVRNGLVRNAARHDRLTLSQLSAHMRVLGRE